MFSITKIKKILIDLSKGEISKYYKYFIIFLRVMLISKVINAKNKDKKIFIDLGANTGQAFNFFKKFFIDFNFVLVKPNPECLPYLNKLKKNFEVTIINEAAYIKNSYKKFYTRDTNFFQGSSIENFHNKNMATKDTFFFQLKLLIL